jgi:hypothetical protein
MTARKRPAPNGKPALSNRANGYTDSSVLPGYQRHEPLTAEDRADAAALAAAEARGFRLATRCLRCGQWLVAPSSVRAHLGPVCRAKAVAE